MLWKSGLSTESSRGYLHLGRAITPAMWIGRELGLRLAWWGRQDCSVPRPGHPSTHCFGWITFHTLRAPEVFGRSAVAWVFPTPLVCTAEPLWCQGTSNHGLSQGWCFKDSSCACFISLPKYRNYWHKSSPADATVLGQMQGRKARQGSVSTQPILV
jgi:hypothetical protein